SAGAGGTGGLTGPAFHMESSIVANNTAAGVETDIGTLADGISGTRNLIMASNVPPPADTIGDDPMLGPLQDNGGLSPTHALLPDSPAIDHGSASVEDKFDQRFKPRVSNFVPDIGAFELEETLFSNGFEPPVD